MWAAFQRAGPAAPLGPARLCGYPVHGNGVVPPGLVMIWAPNT